jgi:hypothetical protein
MVIVSHKQELVRKFNQETEMLQVERLFYACRGRMYFNLGRQMRLSQRLNNICRLLNCFESSYQDLLLEKMLPLCSQMVVLCVGIFVGAVSILSPGRGVLRAWLAVSLLFWVFFFVGFFSVHRKIQPLIPFGGGHCLTCSSLYRLRFCIGGFC